MMPFYLKQSFQFQRSFKAIMMAAVVSIAAFSQRLTNERERMHGAQTMEMRIGDPSPAISSRRSTWDDAWPHEVHPRV
jgi:hypothetical protein